MYFKTPNRLKISHYSSFKTRNNQTQSKLLDLMRKYSFCWSCVWICESTGLTLYWPTVLLVKSQTGNSSHVAQVVQAKKVKKTHNFSDFKYLPITINTKIILKIVNIFVNFKLLNILTIYIQIICSNSWIEEFYSDLTNFIDKTCNIRLWYRK